MIHCLKPGELAHDAAELIARETTALNSSTTQPDSSFEDPFMDLDDGSEEDDGTLIEDDQNIDFHGLLDCIIIQLAS